MGSTFLVFCNDMGSVYGWQTNIDRFLHPNLAAQEGPLFGGESRGNYIPPNPACAADFDFFGGDIPLQAAGNNDDIGAHMLAGYPPGFANNQHPPDGDITFESAFYPHPPIAAY